jgi:hypothetical protein
VLWYVVAQGRQRNRGPLSVYVRGVLGSREVSKILAFLYGTGRSGHGLNQIPEPAASHTTPLR